MTTRTLITGGTGFLGRALIATLLERYSGEICVYSRGEHTQALVAKQFNTDRLHFFIGDVRDLSRLERAMHGVTDVIHAAALKRIEVGHYNPDEMIKTNVYGTMNVIEAARRAGVERAVLVSSDKAFEPVSPYGCSKAMAEQLFFGAQRMNLGPKFKVCRYGNVAGSTGSVIPTWREAIAKGEPITITHPDCTRFWMFLKEAVELVLYTLELYGTPPGPVIPTLPAYRLGDLAAAMRAIDCKITGLNHWEKMHESMETGKSSDTAPRMNIQELREALNRV